MKKRLFLIFLFLFTIKLTFAQNDCYDQEDDLFKYHNVLENVSNLDTNFNKTDFINHLSLNEVISNDDIAILNSSIISVSQSFPGIESEFLASVVDVDATVDIFNIISNFNNSISLVECRSGDGILSLNANFYNKEVKIALVPNPTNGLVFVESENQIKEIKVFNQLGQKIITQSAKELDLSNLTAGIFVVEVNLDNNKKIIKKIIKK